MNNFPLHDACLKRDLDLVKLLIERGASVSINEKNNYGETPLHIACYENSNSEIVKFLITHGANVNEKSDDVDTPLQYACLQAYNLEIIKLLIEYGGDVYINEKDDDGDTLLHIACISERPNNLEIAKFLITCGADYTIKNNKNKTFLDQLSGNSKIEIEKFIEDFNSLDIKQPEEK